MRRDVACVTSDEERPLFEKELDNFNEEPVLLAQ
jgi:hypothetical protein